MTSVFTVKMDDHYGNNKCNVEKNVPVAFILTRRWQDGAEILGTETWRCLSQTSRSKHYLKCGLVVVKWSTCSPSTRTVWVQFPLMTTTVFSVNFVFEKAENEKNRGRGWPVWNRLISIKSNSLPDKNRQMSIKVAQKWFHKKNEWFDTFTKIA